MSLLPADGDTGYGLNGTILQAIEATPARPLWDVLEEGENEWVRTFSCRLENAGIHRPE